ncbi:MAG: YfbK domain-containing protein, partial [Phycisphaeraceae bacterium]
VPFAEASEATRFASSVAAMGMILRGSPHKGTATTKWVALTAEDAKTFDPHGYRDEFFRLATRVGAIEAKNKEAFGQHQID